MEKMSRMSKYKDLREGIKKDVVSNTQTTYTQQQEPVRDADYYKRFLASEESALEKPSKLQNAMNDDTLVEPMTIDTINSQVDEELERALSRVRQESGQEDYNTRVDILNKIRQSKMLQEAQNSDEEESEELIDDEEENDDEEASHRFGFFKRHQDEDEEDDDEEEEEEEPEETKRGFTLFKRHHDEEDDELDEEENDDEDDEDDEENSTFVKVLNGIIVVLGIVLIALIGYIAKEFFF